MYICTCTTKVPVTLIASEQHIETNTKQIMIEQVQCHVESVIQAFVHYVMYYSYYYPITSPRNKQGFWSGCASIRMKSHLSEQFE